LNKWINKNASNNPKSKGKNYPITQPYENCAKAPLCPVLRGSTQSPKEEEKLCMYKVIR